MAGNATAMHHHHVIECQAAEMGPQILRRDTCTFAHFAVAAFDVENKSVVETGIHFEFDIHPLRHDTVLILHTLA